jgi:hypothetical protein
MREPLGTSGLKEGAVGAVNAMKTEARGENEPLEEKKWQYVCRLFG